MGSFRISRRTLLRGIGGVALALPALEIMGSSRASADGGAIPMRYAVLYGGCSMGNDSGDDQSYLVVPETLGLGYESTRALKPLFDLGVDGDVSIVSGLKVPWQDGGDVPPGGRVVEFHYGPSITPQLCGMRSLYRDAPCTGPTSDQIVAAAIGGGTLFDVLNYRVQPVDYDGGGTNAGDEGRLSWKQDGGGVVGIDPIVSPRLAYQSLFSGFTPPDPADAVKAAQLLDRKKSAIDLVHASIDRLMPRLGKADALRMQRHLDEVRDLEKRLDALHPPNGSACKLLPDPGDDPETTGKYSNEDLRADVLTDLLAMAFACDLSRAATLMVTMWKCYMSMFEIEGVEADLHAISHGSGSKENNADGVAWHTKQFGRLMKKLKDLPELDGSTVLDHTAAVMVFEGGLGYDPEGGFDNSPHSTENMIVLIGGRAGGLKSGQHVAASGKHPANVIISAMNAVGVDAGLGEVEGNIPELFG